MDQIDVALLVVRVVVGLTMALHGANKVRGGIEGTVGWFNSIGMRPPRAQAWMAALTELVGGVMFGAGLLMPLSAAALIGLMVVAYVVAHRPNGFFIFNKNQGWEYVFVLAVVALGVGIAGPGRFSLDHAFGIAFHGWTSGLITLLVGMLPAIGLLAACYRPPTKSS